MRQQAMRGVAAQPDQGLRPVDPISQAEHISMSDIIKFRVDADEKRRIMAAADRAGITASDLLRRAGRAAVSGRIVSRAVLSDLVLIRATANRLAAMIDDPAVDQTKVAAGVKAAVDDFRQIAARHLGDVR
jgi:hypothetical protein